MRSVIATVLCGLCLGVTCQTLPPPVDPSAPDAGPEPEDAAAEGALPPEPGPTVCDRACQRMQRLDCPGHAGSAAASCAEVCENHESSQIGSFCPDELAQIQGRELPDGGRECDEAELQAAFEACL